MSEPPAEDAPSGEAAARALARDWITIWESELASLATDRELGEFWTRLLALWTRAAGLGSVSPATDERAGATPKARAATAPPPPDAGRALFERLDRRLAALEARLAALESRLDETRVPAPGGPRGRRRARTRSVPPRRPR